MPGRKEPLVAGEIYHVFSKSISEMIVFRNVHDFERMLELMIYYRYERPLLSFSDHQKSSNLNQSKDSSDDPGPPIVDIITYCLMDTHFHFTLKQLTENGISDFMQLVLNSYTKYFNLKEKPARKGTLWEGKFSNVRVTSDEQLLHLSRYIHLNPVTAHLIDRPEDWKYSSYREYLEYPGVNCICNYKEYLDIAPDSYSAFVNEHIEPQRERAKVK